MARYYFHVRAHGMLIEDQHGVILPNARLLSECQRIIEGTLRKASCDDLPDCSFEVEDESGVLVLVVPFASKQRLMSAGPSTIQ